MKNKVLITGGCGFIGSHLAEMFVQKGYNVIVFDRYNINNDYGWLNNSKYKKDIEIILGDIRDYDSVFNAVQKCSKVIHLAALIGIPYSYISPLAYIKTNIEGTYNILESSKKLNVDQVLITSTSEVYGTAQYEPIDEIHPHVAQSPYSASKIGADKLSLSYHRSFNLPVKIIRPFNVFGPRQSLRAIIPTIINQLLNTNNLKLGNL
ncbi:SDR family NAD(P)-dependent oxidoreductase, partial [Pelagibacteraceae bacterium]|nr:SDR family NAD(P)-dependent oxidoreductase [Pelagibacteraceae bacterium]